MASNGEGDGERVEGSERGRLPPVVIAVALGLLMSA